MWDLRFGVSNLGLVLEDLRLRVQGFELRVSGLGLWFMVWSFGFRARSLGFGFMVYVLGYQV